MNWFRKQNLITKIGAAIGAIVGFLAALIAVLQGWPTLQPFINSIVALIASFLNFSIPLWLLMAFIAVGIWSLRLSKHNVNNETADQPIKLVKFRGLLFKVDYKPEFPKVLNRDSREALCGECGSSIVGLDRGMLKANYLRCANGDFVGSDRPYAEFKRIQKEEQEKQSKATQAEYEKREAERRQRALSEGKEPAPNYDAGAGSYPQPAFGRRSDETVIQEFYDKVVDDLEQKLQREKFTKMTVKEAK